MKEEDWQECTNIVELKHTRASCSLHAGGDDVSVYACEVFTMDTNQQEALSQTSEVCSLL